jgi:ParB-like chromosome segregation protein Spo0J
LNRIVENLQREDLRPIELSKGIEALSRSFKKTDEQIARSLGKSAGVIKQWRLLSRLPDSILERLGTAESATEGGPAVTPRHLARVLSRLPESDATDPAAKRAREDTLSWIREFFDKVERVGGINAHQSDAAWSMTLKGESDIGEAVEIVAADPDAYRYKRSQEPELLPPPITSGERLEEETFQYLLNLAVHFRTKLSQARPAIVQRLSARHRSRLLPTWEQVDVTIDEVIDAIRDKERPQAPDRKRLPSAGGKKA